MNFQTSTADSSAGNLELGMLKARAGLQLFVAKKVIPALPKDERFRLGGQILRCARYVTARIVEGYGRFPYLDNTEFCSNARGILLEVLNHLITARDEDFISEDFLQRGRKMTGQTVRTVNGYMNYLKDRQKVRPAENRQSISKNY